MVSAVGLGSWSMSGMATPGTSYADSLATIRVCFDLGINHIDTAFCYGRTGEWEKLIRDALGQRRDEMIIATKAGIHWDEHGYPVFDASPVALRRQCELSLKRLNTDHVDLLYLHAPDNKVPIAESAGTLKQLIDEGKTRSAGVSNTTLSQLKMFALECPVVAFQPLYNMLQRNAEYDTIPYCRRQGIAVLSYSPIAKGILAGKFTREHVFSPADERYHHPLYQKHVWARNIETVEKLKAVAVKNECTLVELVTAWIIRKNGTTAAICGAKRPEQIAEFANAVTFILKDEIISEIERILSCHRKCMIGMEKRYYKPSQKSLLAPYLCWRQDLNPRNT